jgi:hypothetical protein
MAIRFVPVWRYAERGAHDQERMRLRAVLRRVHLREQPHSVAHGNAILALGIVRLHKGAARSAHGKTPTDKSNQKSQ